MDQRGKPTSAAEPDADHLSKMKLAAIVTAVCATALAVVFLAASRSTAAVARTTQAKPTHNSRHMAHDAVWET